MSNVFKCKMCGGDLEITPGSSVATCAYCGSQQTAPNADNEKKNNLYNRANRLRFSNDFDKAAGVFESIVAEFPDEAEAYWGLCLCKYGIEYVDDPLTAKKIPTCHRTAFESIFDDSNYKNAMECAFPEAQSLYHAEAKEIDRLQKAILEIVKNETPYDVFICYKETDENGQRTKDSVQAQDIYTALIDAGYKTFFARITLEDKLGEEFEPYIFSALNSAKVMLVVGTCFENMNATWVKNEWSRYIQIMKKEKGRSLIPCYSDMDAYDMPEEFRNLQAQDMSKIGADQDLVRGVQKIIGDTSKNNNEHVINELLEERKIRQKKEEQNKQKFRRIKVSLIAVVSLIVVVFAGKFGHKKYVENLPIDKMSIELNKNNISDYFGVETVETTNKRGNKKTPTIMYSKMYDDGWIYLPEESDIEFSIKFYETDKQWELGSGQYNTLDEYRLYCTVYEKKTVNATFGYTRGNATFVNSKCVKEYIIDENGRHIVLINGQEYYDDNYDFYDIPWCGRPY